MDPNRRSDSYAFSMTERAPKEYFDFRANVINLTKFIHSSFDYQRARDIMGWEERFNVRRFGSLGPNNPHAHLYRAGGERNYKQISSRWHSLSDPMSVLAKHEAAWSVYVAPFAPTRTDATESFIKRDREGRLHAPDGPALQHSNLAIYYWHGTRIPARYITDQASITLETLFTRANTEQRRAATEIIGWDKLLATYPHRIVDKDGDPEIGELIEVTINPPVAQASWNPPIVERFVRVRCGTGRMFSIPVPPNTQTALQAQAWMWGVPADQFKPPEIRT